MTPLSPPLSLVEAAFWVALITMLSAVAVGEYLYLILDVRAYVRRVHGRAS